MNSRCTICDAIIPRKPGEARCPECGARPSFQTATGERPRHARALSAGDSGYGWDFGPDGPVLRRIR
jgi:hypothetical protein